MIGSGVLYRNDRILNGTSNSCEYGLTGEEMGALARRWEAYGEIDQAPAFEA